MPTFLALDNTQLAQIEVFGREKIRQNADYLSCNGLTTATLKFRRSICGTLKQIIKLEILLLLDINKLNF